jgi:hypothetical protein
LVERLNGVQEVVGSNPASPTDFRHGLTQMKHRSFMAKIDINSYKSVFICGEC